MSIQRYGAEVSLRTVIGKKAKRPMVLETPVYISHMSFGALSKEIKIALAKGAAAAGTAAFCKNFFWKFTATLRRPGVYTYVRRETARNKKRKPIGQGGEEYEQ